MEADPTGTELAQRLTEGIVALRGGRAEEAASLFGPVADALSEVPELLDIYARARSLQAQALLEAGRATEARVPVRDALDALRTLGDADGLAAVGELEQRIGAALTDAFQAAARRRALRSLADKPLDDIIAGIQEPARRAEALVRRATASLAAARPADAEEAARRALAEAEAAGDLKHEVLARLAWARARPEHAQLQLERARQRADDANEHNLVTAIAQTATELRVSLVAPDAP